MFLYNKEKIVYNILENKISSSYQAIYIFIAISVNILYNIPFSFELSIQSVTLVLDILFLIINIILVKNFYQINKEIDDKDLIKRFVIMYFVINFTLFLTIGIPAIIICSILLIVININFDTIVLIVNLIYFFCFLIYYFLMNKTIKYFKKMKSEYKSRGA